MRSIEWRNLPPGTPSAATKPIISRKARRSQSSAKSGSVVLVLDRAEPVEAAEVVHAVHAENPTAIVLWRFELSDGAMRVKSATNR